MIFVEIQQIHPKNSKKSWLVKEKRLEQKQKKQTTASRHGLHLHLGGESKKHPQKDPEKKTYHLSKKSPTEPTERTPKPGYLIALVTFLGVRW